jgi:uncharacterized protein (DUF305 family)
MTKKTLTVLLIALSLGIVICKDQSQVLADPEQSAQYDFSANQDRLDQHFIQMMIPHHQGAVDMARLALNRAKHPELKKLAQSIEKSQSQEIRDMRAWYSKWYGKNIPDSKYSSGMMHGGEMGMHGDGGCGMGMMGNVDLESLKNSANFDRAFINDMIAHHKMGVMMASWVLNSKHPELRKLAMSIIQSQSAEIEQMYNYSQSW